MQVGSEIILWQHQEQKNKTCSATKTKDKLFDLVGNLRMSVSEIALPGCSRINIVKYHGFISMLHYRSRVAPGLLPGFPGLGRFVVSIIPLPDAPGLLPD